MGRERSRNRTRAKYALLLNAVAPAASQRVCLMIHARVKFHLNDTVLCFLQSKVMFHALSMLCEVSPPIKASRHCNRRAFVRLSLRCSVSVSCGNVSTYRRRHHANCYHLSVLTLGMLSPCLRVSVCVCKS